MGKGGKEEGDGRWGEKAREKGGILKVKVPYIC